jgi:peptidylprolyl isomerase
VPQPAAPVGEEVTTPSGLKYQDIVVGTGATPQQGDLCVMHYVGTLEDGKKFDSSYDHGRPFEYHFGVDGVIEGWREGVSTMKAGGKRKLVIPSHIGYGASGSPPVIPPNATLIFEVELLEVRHGQ